MLPPMLLGQTIKIFVIFGITKYCIGEFSCVLIMHSVSPLFFRKIGKNRTKQNLNNFETASQFNLCKFEIENKNAFISSCNPFELQELK